MLDLRVVLVRSLYEANIGSSSRAMANMGADKLILIDPKCEITYTAQQAAATGQSALQNRKVYSNWEEFLTQEPEGLRLAFSARDGRARPSQKLTEVLNRLEEKHPAFKKRALPIYLIFGPEDAGLANEDLELAHYCVRLPTFGENTSLNLSQAVLLGLFMVQERWSQPGRKSKSGKTDEHKLGTQEQSLRMSKLVKSWLTEMGFDLSKPKMNAFTVMNRLLLHNVPTEKELRVLEIVLQQSIRKLRALKSHQRPMK